MTGWSARAAFSSMPLGLIPLALFGLGCGVASQCGGNDDCEGVALLSSLVLCGVASVIIGWRRPQGFMGPALGATLALLAIMLLFSTTPWPFQESAMFGGLVAGCELVGIAGRATVGIARRWGRA